jgi:hypothetical protein
MSEHEAVINERALSAVEVLNATAILDEDDDEVEALSLQAAVKEQRQLDLEQEQGAIPSQMSIALRRSDKDELMRLRQRAIELPVDLRMVRLDLKQTMLAYRQAQEARELKEREGYQAQLIALAEKIYAATEVLMELKNQEGDLAVGASGCTAALENLRSDIFQLKAEIEALLSAPMES